MSSCVSFRGTERNAHPVLANNAMASSAIADHNTRGSEAEGSQRQRLRGGTAAAPTDALGAGSGLRLEGPAKGLERL